MGKISQKKCIELLIKAACKKGHILEKDKDTYLYKHMFYCKGCHQSAQWRPQAYKEQSWAPWWGSLIADTPYKLIYQEPAIEGECWGINYEVKYLKDRGRQRVIAREVIAKITSKLSRQEVEALINALMWDVDFKEVPENDGSEKRDDWPHAMPERREAA